jgi:hypothetical protein
VVEAIFCFLFEEFLLMPSYDKPNRSTFFNGHFYDKMAEDLQLTGKSQRTVHGYLRAVRQLADYCGKPFPKGRFKNNPGKWPKKVGAYRQFQSTQRTKQTKIRRHPPLQRHPSRIRKTKITHSELQEAITADKNHRQTNGQSADCWAIEMPKV